MAKLGEILNYLEMAFPNSSNKDSNDGWYIININDYYVNIAFRIDEEDTGEHESITRNNL